MNAKFDKIVAAIALMTCAINANAADTFSSTIKACDDFYGYVNEAWLNATTIPDDRAEYGSFTDIQINNEKILKAALAEVSLSPEKLQNPAIRKVADYYASGLDIAAIEAAGIKPLEPVLSRIAGVRDRKQLATVFGELLRMGFPVGMLAGVQSDAKDRTQYLIELLQGGLGLPDRDYYFRDDAKSREIRAAYLKYATQLLMLADDDEATATRRAQAAYKIETALAKASMTAVQKRDPMATYNKMDFAQLQKAAPGFDWAAYFDAQKMSKPNAINVAQPQFAKAFAKLVETDELIDVKSYLRVQVLNTAATKLSQQFVDLRFGFYGTLLSGRKTLRPREERIIADLAGNYGDAPLSEGLGQLFVERAFSAEAKTRAITMVNNIKAALRTRLQTLEWMSPQTRIAATKKLDAMALLIGYPDKWKDLSAAEINRSDYLNNWIHAHQFDSDWWVAKLGTTVDRNQWWMSPQTVNAYAGDYNEIVFPAGILQPPFFDEKADDASNYGAIGTIIGHEITHHFDDHGRQFDEMGNLKEWWIKPDATRFNVSADALVKQYNSYVGANGIKTNGKLTLGENIADFGGIKLSYLGLQNALKQNPASAVNGMTANQRFFTSFAVAWRDKVREAAEAQQLQTDPHSISKFRVKGAIANLPQFGEAFSCKPGDSALRAEKDRVVIW